MGLYRRNLYKNGWFPNKDLAQLAGPMITYLIPLLIAFSGGRLIHGLRGGIIAATATMGVIVALPDTPMLLGAMIMGPLVGWLMKKLTSLFNLERHKVLKCCLITSQLVF